MKADISFATNAGIDSDFYYRQVSLNKFKVYAAKKVSKSNLSGFSGARFFDSLISEGKYSSYAEEHKDAVVLYMNEKQLNEVKAWCADTLSSLKKEGEQKLEVPKVVGKKRKSKAEKEEEKVGRLSKLLSETLAFFESNEKRFHTFAFTDLMEFKFEPEEVAEFFNNTSGKFRAELSASCNSVFIYFNVREHQENAA